LLVVPI
jgi:hypothetical protein